MRSHGLIVLSVVAGVIALTGACSREDQTRKTGTATETGSPEPLRGPQIVRDMIAAHGGMEGWRSAPTMSFTDSWESPGRGEGPASTFVIEQSRRRAYMDMPGTDISLAWDGEKAWSTNWPDPTPVRFLALLNYYFINLPWLTQDPGVLLGEPATGRLRDDPTEYVTVMMTFEPGIGDTPDDYYRLYIHPETKLLRACDYIVTYRALLGEGSTSTPEHCLVFDEMTTVDGLTMPAHFTIYEEENVYAACSIRDISFTRPFDESRMTMPDGGVVDTSTP